MNPLEVVADHLAPIMTDWAVVFFQWYDEEVQSGAPKSVLIRPSGGSVANELGQKPGVTIAIATKTAAEAYEFGLQVRDYFIENHYTEGVANFEILGDVIGPRGIEGQRQYSEINLLVWT